MSAGTSQPKRRSPFVRRERRQAGQSLRERLATERDGFLFFVGGIGIGALVVTCAVWLTGLLRLGSALAASATITAALILLGAVGAWARLQRGKRDAMGLRGEIVSAEWLQSLVGEGYRVIHDLQTDHGNIDHLAVGPAGVFVFETKARSKAPGDRVEYDGRTLRVGGVDVTGQVLTQAQRNARAVRDRLRSASDLCTHIAVRAVVLYPGWDVDESKASGAEVWVLNPKNRVLAWVKQEEKFAGTANPSALAAASGAIDAWAREGED